MLGVTIKYSSAGVALWTNRFDDPGWSCIYLHAIAVDASGNVYVAGSSGPPSDYLTIKYSSAGMPLWTNRYDGMGGGDSATALALDASGNVFVTGQSDNTYGGTGNKDFATVAYSSAGEPLWSNRYDGPANGDDRATALAVDSSGNVYVTGQVTTRTLPWYTDFATIKYSNSGVPLWTNLYNAGSLDSSGAIAVDTVGNVIVLGASTDANGYPDDHLTIKYSSAGVPLWTNHYCGPTNSGYCHRAVAVDADGNVYVTAGADTFRPVGYATIKYSGAGVGLWTNPGPRGTAMALAVNTSGTVFVTGFTEDIPGKADSRDYATIAYSSAGVPLWTNRYNGPGNGEDGADAIALGPNDAVYVTGSANAGPGDLPYTITTVKYANATPAISIIRQPLSRTNAVGTTASFSVEAMGSPPLSYLWRKEGVNLADDGRLSGVTTAYLAIADVQPSDEGDYTVVVANEHGSATSTVAHLTVVVPPSAGRFTNLAYSPATGFSFVFRDATVGQQYRIQRSPSAAAGSWSDWQSFTYIEPVGLMDVGATGAERRYYRAISP